MGGQHEEFLRVCELVSKVEESIQTIRDSHLMISDSGVPSSSSSSDPFHEAGMKRNEKMKDQPSYITPKSLKNIIIINIIVDMNRFV